MKKAIWFCISMILMISILTSCIQVNTNEYEVNSLNSHWIFTEIEDMSYEEAEKIYQNDLSTPIYESSTSMDKAIWTKAYIKKYGQNPQQMLNFEIKEWTTIIPEIDHVNSITIINNSESSTIITELDDNSLINYSIDGSENAGFGYYKEVINNKKKYKAYIIKGNSIIILNNDKKWEQIAVDFLYYLEAYNDEFYYINTKNQFVNTKGDIIQENVYGIDTNKASKTETYLYV